MNPKIRSLILSLGLVAAAGLPSDAARISEPGTTFYGRVVTRVGTQEFPITEGELRWTVAIPAQGGRELELTAKLQPLAGGVYSYKITVPHQALAFDLTVTDRNVPLTAAGWQIKHLRMRVNGREARVLAPAVDSFTASQTTRALTHRVDLEVPEFSPDSDGDGVPDWWEDQAGTDKWNPNDRPTLGGTTGGSGGAFTGSTFAQWRTHYFPQDATTLDVFARQDSDADGVSNLLEYAFELDPNVADATAVQRLPQPRLVDGRAGILFTRRTGVTDLNYQVELSGDLTQWTTDSGTLEELAPAAEDAGPGRACVCVKSSSAEANPVFLRVQVALKP